MVGREAWQSVPKEASLGRRRICRDVCENTGSSLILTPSSTLSILLSFRATGNQTGRDDHTKSLKCILLCSPTWARIGGKSFVKNEPLLLNHRPDNYSAW